MSSIDFVEVGPWWVDKERFCCSVVAVDEEDFGFLVCW